MAIIEAGAFLRVVQMHGCHALALTACGCCRTRHDSSCCTVQIEHGLMVQSTLGAQEGRPGGACLIDQELWRRPLCMAHAAMHASDDAHPPGRVLQHVLLQQMVPKATQLQNIAQASVGTCSLVYLLASPLLVLCADRGTSSTRCSHSRRAETSQTCRCSASRVPVLLSLKKRKTCSSRLMAPISQANHELLACSGLQLFSRV